MAALVKVVIPVDISTTVNVTVAETSSGSSAFEDPRGRFKIEFKATSGIGVGVVIKAGGVALNSGG